jgi:hypothetical protein
MPTDTITTAALQARTWAMDSLGATVDDIGRL